MAKTTSEYTLKCDEYKAKGLVYYTPKEEVWNASSHGLGAVFGLFGFTYLLAMGDKSAFAIVAAFLYLIGVGLPYAFSCAYHGAKDLNRKRTLRKVDHAGISFIIFGNSAPMCLLYFGGTGVYYVVAISLAICIANVILCLIDLERFATVALIMDLLCAGVGVVGFVLCRDNILWSAKICYIIGSVMCLTGLVFYGRRQKYMHTVFHIFMAAGTAVYFGALALAL